MTEPEPEDVEELIIAVYLDTNVLLDLLATVEDGFALVERVTTGQGAGSTSERSTSGEFGAPRVLSLFKLGFSGKLGRSTAATSNETTEAEVTHTYGSLLHRLRSYLVEEGLVRPSATTETNTADLSVGSFVEFNGVVRPNPFTDSFRRVQRMLKFAEVAMAFDSEPSPQPSGGRQGQGRGQGQGRRPSANPQNAQLQAISDFLEQLTADVEREGTTTVVLEDHQSGYSALVTLFDDYLRDRSMAELLNREFRVLGKVARHLPAGSTEKVDLLASSGIAGFPPEILSQLASGVGELSGSGGAQLKAPLTATDPPVVEIIPVAIYL